MSSLLPVPNKALLAVAMASIAFSLSASGQDLGERVKYNFNPEWKFIKADAGEAQQVNFDDSRWSTVSVPHTFNDIDTFDDMSEGRHNGESNQWRGTVWYRKHFRLPKSDEGKAVFIEFESVRQVADVYINGVHLGQNRTGFLPFGYELTEYLNYGDESNVIAVKANNDRGDHFRKNDPLVWHHEHWHPNHGGIYRNVFLHVMDPLHITLPLYDNLETVGTYVFTENVSETSADVTVEAEVMNNHGKKQSVTFIAEIIDADGNVVETVTDQKKLAAKAKHTFSVSGSVANPKRWYPRHPYLYKVVTQLKVDNQIVDGYETPLGIRSFEFNNETGFWINGESDKLTGWGQKPTNSWAGLGAALPDWLRDFTFRLMDEAGGNFIRWGHCAGSPAEAHMADKYGFVTLMPGISGESQDDGETWDIRIAGFRDTVIYYRNHPSIFIWEGGNWAESASNYQDILDVIAKYDPNGKRLMGNRRADVKLESEDYVTIEIGTEGWEREYPHLPLIESEYCRDEAPRRVWDPYSPDNDFFNNPNLKRNVYKFASEQFAVRQADHWWNKMGKKTFHSGGANWIFSDGPHGGRNPTENTRASGEVDAVRLPKEAFYALKSMWRPEPQVHIVGHWNYDQDTVKDIYVISNCPSVKLYLNGEVIGSNDTPENAYVFQFTDIAWKPGTLKAEAFIDGNLRASQSKETAGAPAALRLTSITGPNGWRADGSDVALIDFEVIDSEGRRCPLDQSKVDFAVKGPGIWRGGYNSGKVNSTNNLFLETEAGINRVSIRSLLKPGTVTVTASREGLPDATIEITSHPVEIVDGLTTEMPQVYPQNLGDPEPLPAYTPPMPDLAPNTEMTSELFAQFSYTGDHEAILRTNAYWGKKAWTDLEYNYTRIPFYLHGAEYIRTPNADRGYWARDLLQFIAGKDMIIWVGHDDLVERPEFLSDYQDTGDDIDLGGSTLSLFKREVKAGESIIMAGNSDSDISDEARMYVVLAKER
ncbi:DUF4982 domain-containing protein [Pelagicoccus sp. NFK12]|uniref:DUF4982 domain-containing protein n=1 Tax=Pelagicoccus enzymogenes TaxID=2773457 RepID=A0A927IHQ4_9BACT|nr:sugar-binding domain-containing protein [Pelagicoccus enzymogenes]MBD5780044.1 DUF4982 domain-containing protein [Pelagicoccus enzymogenes]